jgi:TetR/AcrR family transcriptional regulator, fatty acid metabolism regulator protein
MEMHNKPTLREAGKSETRRLLFQVALELFAEKGFEKTRASEIAEKAGVAVGTIYLHFGSKEGLLRAILVHVADDIYARVKEVYEQNPSAPPEALARMHIEQIVQSVEENRKLASFVLGYALSRHPVGAQIIDLMVSQVEQGIRQGQATGIYRTDILLPLAARAEGHMNLGLISWWIEHPTLATRDEIVDTLVKFRLSGLYAPAK